MIAAVDTLNASAWLLLRTSDTAIGLEVFTCIALGGYGTVFAVLSCFGR